MKRTGIVRRIDDLGRIVIPKEIRRTALIRESDPMEISIGDNGEIILTKYSTMASLTQFARNYAQALNKASGYAVLICDRSRVKEAAGMPRKFVVEKQISLELADSGAFSAQSADTRCKPVMDSELEAIAWAPIIVDGETDGYIVLLAQDENSVAGDTESKLLLTAATFIGSLLSGY